MGSHVTLATIKLASAVGDADEEENLWVFSSDIAQPAWSDLQGPLAAFYETAMSGHWSSELAVGQHAQYELYDISAHLNGSPHGAPFAMGSMTGTIDIGGVGLPAQCAAVVDYHADLTGISEFGPGTRPRARRRGRHYHGPIQTADLAHAPTSNSAVWGTTLLTDLASGYSALKAAVGVGLEWDVWSRKDAAVYPVVGGWIDHTVRTQRRRVEPTGLRSFWS